MTGVTGAQDLPPTCYFPPSTLTRVRLLARNRLTLGSRAPDAALTLAGGTTTTLREVLQSRHAILYFIREFT